MATRDPNPKTAETEQGILNKSFDKKYDVLATEVLVENEAGTALERITGDGAGNLNVNIAAGSSSGTQYTEGATDATITGTVTMWEDESDTIVAASAAKPFPVEIVAGAGSGGTASADDADFSAGSTSGTPSMGVYESTPTSVTDGDMGIVGITSDRRVKVLADLSATDNAVLDQIELNTDPLLVVGSGTEATAQRVTIATDSTGVLSVDDNGSTLSIDDGGGVITVDGTVAVTHAALTELAAAINSDKVDVNIVSGSSSGVQYTEGDTDATITGTAVLWEGDADALLTVSNDNPLPVQFATSPTVEIAGTASVSVVSALPAGDDNIGNVDIVTLPGDVEADIDQIRDQIDLITPDIEEIRADADSIRVATELIDDVIYVDDADWTDSTSKHALVGGLYQSTPQTVTDGDVAPFNITANGALHVADGGGSLTVDGTVTANLSATDNQVLDDIKVDTEAIETAVEAIQAAQLPDGHNVTVDNASLAVTNAGLTELAAAINASSQMDVNIAASDISFGGTSAADDADFTDGTTPGTPGMGVYEATPTTVTDGDLGVVGITETRALKVQAQANSGVDIGDVTINNATIAVTQSGTWDEVGINDSGNSITVDASQLDVDNLNPTDDIVAIGDGTSTATVRNLAANDALNVAIVDGSGDQITSFGGGTQYSDGDANADPTGTVAMGTDGSNVFAVHTDTSGDLQVDILSIAAGDNNIGNVDVASSALPTGASTLAEQQSQTTHLATIAGDTTSIQAATELIDDAIYADDADWTDNTSKHMLVGGIYQSSPHTVTDGDVAPISLDDNGNVKVNIVAGSSSGVQYTEGDTDASITGNALMLEKDADTLTAAKDDAGFGEDLTSGLLSVHNRLWDGTAYDRTPGNSTDGMLVNLGSNNDVTVSGVSTAANQSTIIGHLDGVEGLLTTIDTDTGNMDTSLNAIEAGYATEGSALGSGVLLQGDDGTDRTNVLVDTSGHLQVDVLTAPSTAVTNAGTFATQIDGAALTALQLIDNSIYVDDADWTADTSSHTLVGAVTQVATTANTDGDTTPLTTNAMRELRTAVNESDLATAGTAHVKKYYTNAGAVTDGIIWSPAAGKRWYVTDIFINVSAAATVTLEDDLAGGDSAVWKAELAANSGWSHSFNTPLYSGEDAADLIVTTTAGNVYITVTGYEI